MRMWSSPPPVGPGRNSWGRSWWEYRYRVLFWIPVYMLQEYLPSKEEKIFLADSAGYHYS